MNIQAISTRLFTYVKESLYELKRVVWPTRKQAITHSIAVVVMSIAVAAFLAGLDLDAWRRPFGIMPEILAHATYVEKCQASCFVCGRPAQFTQKLGGDPSKTVEPGDHYEARCFRCHVMPEDLVAESLGASIIKASTV